MKSNALMNRLRSCEFGVTLPYRAFRLILSNKTLLLFSLIPVGISLLLYGFFILRFQNASHEWIRSYLQSHGASADGWALWTAQVLLSLLLFAASALTFSITTSIIASPFNDFLAERTEPLSSPPLPPAPKSGILRTLKNIVIDVTKTLVALGAGVIALFVSWIPVVNLLAFAITALLVTFQYISYPQTRRGLGVFAGLAFLWNHSYACLSFGAVMMALFTVPFFAVFMLPIAVVGGTLLVARAQQGAGPFEIK